MGASDEMLRSTGGARLVLVPFIVLVLEPVLVLVLKSASASSSRSVSVLYWQCLSARASADSLC